MDETYEHDTAPAEEDDASLAEIQASLDGEGDASGAEASHDGPDKSAPTPQAEEPPAAAEDPPVVEEPSVVDASGQTVEEAAAVPPDASGQVQTQAEEDVPQQTQSIDTALPDVAPGPRAPRVPWWPFVVYLAAWVGLVGASILALSYEAEALPAIQQEPYPYLILGGLVLTLLGPVSAVTVWLVVWKRAGKGRRAGLLTSALVRGAGVTLVGVLMWWGTLVAVDALRLGLLG